jgi:hypothetical protein
MVDCNPTHMPMEERLKLSHDGKEEEEDATLYRKIIGYLCYLVYIRPDLIFTFRYLSHSMQQQREKHMAALKQVLHYVADTINHGYSYHRGSGGAKLVGYNDSDYAGDIAMWPGELALSQAASGDIVIL